MKKIEIGFRPKEKQDMETDKSKKYFYADRHSRTVYSAEKILSLLLEKLPPINSAVDIGCGVGTWLSVLKNKGINEILGCDGHWVNPDYLEIPKSNFMVLDLNKPIQINRRFDLAISLEVAEHIPQVDAETFIKSLVSLSDVILFSAAIPYQRGVNHVNEQWPDYWANIFIKYDYLCFDIFRISIWSDDKIPYWYRQNILLFVKNNRLSDIKLDKEEINIDNICPNRLVHADLYIQRASPPSTVYSVILLLGSIKRWFKRLKKNDS